MGSNRQWHYNRGFLKLKYGQLQKHLPPEFLIMFTTCVMNQSQGHWFLSNALITCINLTQAIEIKMGWVFDGTNVLDPFDHEVFFFQKHVISSC
jgi:hypothetical protein